MLNKKSIAGMDVKGKTVLLRVDFNVPLDEGKIRDDTCIRIALSTIEYLISKGAKIVVATHLGRPKGRVIPELKLDPVSRRLSELLGQPVQKLDQVVGDIVIQTLSELDSGEVLMLENLRFEKGEEANDPDFARLLAEPCDLFVNDAFGTAHRAHASTVGVASYIPAVAGLLMNEEITALSRSINNPLHPFTAILGGAKISDKINVIRRFINLADHIVVGGGMANTFLAAKGYSLGSSLYEKDLREEASALLRESKESSCQIVLPVDLVVTKEIKSNSYFEIKKPEQVINDWKAVDIGPETAAFFKGIIADSALIVWNGPLGVFEVPPFDRGTKLAAQAVAHSKAYSIAGGGDLVAALEGLNFSEHISFISTGGGATLEFWEGKTLPGIAVLLDKDE